MLSDVSKINLQWFGDDGSEITLDDVKAFIEANKGNPDIAEFIVSISVDKPLNPELVSAYLQTTEGKNLIQPMMDQRVTEAINPHIHFRRRHGLKQFQS